MIALIQQGLAGGGVGPAPNGTPQSVVKPVPSNSPVHYTVNPDLTPVSLGTPYASRWTLTILPDGGTRIRYGSTAALAISDGIALANMSEKTFERDEGCTGEIFVVSADGTPVPVRVKVVTLP